jgi:hypothetical protein
MKVKNYTNILLVTIAIIGLAGLSTTPAFATNIHNGLDNDLFANQILISEKTGNRSGSASLTTHGDIKQLHHKGPRVRRKSNFGKRWGLYIQGNRINL